MRVLNRIQQGDSIVLNITTSIKKTDTKTWERSTELPAIHEQMTRQDETNVLTKKSQTINIPVVSGNYEFP